MINNINKSNKTINKLNCVGHFILKKYRYNNMIVAVNVLC